MSEEEKKRIGRPPEPVPADIADKIIEGLYEGRALSRICNEPGMPTVRTVCNWCQKDPEFATEFARARREGAASRFDKAGEIVAKATPETVHVAKLQAEHEYKAAACFCPSVFGTKVALGGDASAPPIKVENQGPAVPPLTDYPDPSTGKMLPGLLAGIRKLGELAEELLPGDDA